MYLWTYEVGEREMRESYTGLHERDQHPITVELSLACKTKKNISENASFLTAVV